MPLAAARLHSTQQRAATPAYPNGSDRAGTYTLTFRLRERSNPANILKEHSLVLMPTSFTKRTEARVSVYYTADDMEVDVPPKAIGKTTFQLMGHTGYASVVQDQRTDLLRDLAGPNALQTFEALAQQAFSHLGERSPFRQQSAVDGAAAIKDLQDIFLQYLNPGYGPETAMMAATQDMQFEFLDLTAPTSAEDPVGAVGWEITPEGALVDVREDASKPFLYYYSLQFTGLRQLSQTVPDTTTTLFDSKAWTFRDTLKKMQDVVKDLTNGVNTVKFAVDQLFIQNISGPIGTFLLNTAQLSDAVESVAVGVADKIRWPLYAQRLQTNPLEVARHSVSTLKAAGKALSELFTLRSLGRTLGVPLGGSPVTTTGQDALTVQINGETPRTVHLGAHSEGPALAAALQAAVRAQTPDAQANTHGYRAFTAAWDATEQQFVLTSGTSLSPAAQVHIVTPADPPLTPEDASAALGLGTVRGAHEQRGTDVAVPALTLLQGLDEACAHLLALPDLFAEQLHAADTLLVAHYPAAAIRSAVQGNQHLTHVQIWPGETLQAVAARVGVPWEALALVNHLSYPFIVDAPTELLRARATSADRYHVVSSSLTLTPNQYQGRRLDTIGGAGAGQSRTIVRHDATTFVVDAAFRVAPDSTTDFAIRDERNPILQTGTVTSATLQALTDTSLHLVPDAQAGLSLLMTSGDLTGLRRRIIDQSPETYVLETPAPVAPRPGDTYAVLAVARRAPARYKLVGEPLSVPRATGVPRGGGVQTRLEDVSTVTGRVRSRPEKLFGRDWLLSQGGLVYDPTARDLVTLGGRENLRQAATHLIVLPLGHLPYSPGTGSYVQQELAHSATLGSQQRLLHSAQRTLMEDSRIDGVLQEQLFTHGGRSYLTLGVRAIAGEALERVVIR
jgi:hypothetical protein